MALAGPQKTVLQTVGLVTFMGALAWASVPFYDWFCRVTGFGGTPLTADAAPGAVEGRTITVLFDASTHRDMPWDFKPAQTRMTVTIGEPSIAFYTAHNPTGAPVSGTSTFNVAPLDLGSYFTKIECFCFTEQRLEPGETAQMPVTFFVDPDLLEDPEHKNLQTITLSYTFYRMDEPETAEAPEAQASDRG